MEKLDEFLNNFSSDGTKRTYKSVLKTYFRTIGEDPNTYLPKGKGKYTESDLEKYEKDVKKFWQSINTAPPNTIKSMMACVKVFLMDSYVDLPGKLWKDLRNRTKGTRGVIDDYVPVREDLKKLLSHGNAQERAMFLTLISSGMRIGEVVKIKEEDIDFNNKPVKISIRREYTKTGNKRITFVSDECAEALKEWIKEKPAWLERAVKILNFPQYTKSATDDRVFPMAPDIARAKWNRLLRKTGERFTDQDNSTKNPHFKLHPHCLRKYFRSNLPGDGMEVDVVEALMGHEDGLQRAYRKYNEKQLGDMYMDAMQKVTIFSTQTEDVVDLNKRMQEKDKQLQELLEKQKYFEIRMQGLENAYNIEKLKNGKK